MFLHKLEAFIYVVCTVHVYYTCINYFLHTVTEMLVNVLNIKEDVDMEEDAGMCVVSLSFYYMGYWVVD